MTVILELGISPPFKRLRFIKTIEAFVKSFVGMKMRAALRLYSLSQHPISPPQSNDITSSQSSQTEKKDNTQGFSQVRMWKTKWEQKEKGDKSVTFNILSSLIWPGATLFEDMPSSDMKSQETQEKDRAFCEHEQSFSPAIYYSAISPSRLSHWKAVSLQLQASARAAAGVLLFPSTLTCLLKKIFQV